MTPLIKTDITPTPGTPAALGLSMPAEWEKHSAIWLAWPYDPITFPDRVEKAEETYEEIIFAIHESEPVNLVVLNEDARERVSARLKKRGVAPGRVFFHIREYADVWFRDYGPIFVCDKARTKLAMTHWIFNAWGGKYETLLKDAPTPELINRGMKLRRFEPGIVLEGGSIDVNGAGALLTTGQCLLNSNRNPHLNKNEIEKYLADYLGASHVIWLGDGIAGDDTDGHIDDIARFTDPSTVLCAVEDDPADANHEPLRENLEILKRAADQDGKPLNVVELPMPGFTGDEEGRLPASYANFYIGNTVVLAPVFGHENDSKALDIIQSLFTSRRVVGIDCSDLVFGLGTLHCISQQQPAAGPYGA
ncbi:MAG: agmatine deiminase family protein [bacterium]